MSDRVLDVYLDGRPCGWLTQSTTGNLTFTYDDAYRTAGDATPLSLSMPLVTSTQHPPVSWVPASAAKPVGTAGILRSAGGELTFPSAPGAAIDRGQPSASSRATPINRRQR